MIEICEYIFTFKHQYCAKIRPLRICAYIVINSDDMHPITGPMSLITKSSLSTKGQATKFANTSPYFGRTIGHINSCPLRAACLSCSHIIETQPYLCRNNADIRCKAYRAVPLRRVSKWKLGIRAYWISWCQRASRWSFWSYFWRQTPRGPHIPR